MKFNVNKKCKIKSGLLEKQWLEYNDSSILPSCLEIWLAQYFFANDDGHTWKYITAITSNLSIHAFEYKWPTNHLYIRTVTSALHINVRYLISALSDHHCDGQWTMLIQSYTRQLEKRYNINKTMTVSSWYGITNLLYQFFKCQTIRQDKHSLYRASLIHPSVGLILAYHLHRSMID